VADRHTHAWGLVSVALAILSLLATILVGHHHGNAPWWEILGFILSGCFLVAAVGLFGWPLLLRGYLRLPYRFRSPVIRTRAEATSVVLGAAAPLSPRTAPSPAAPDGWETTCSPATDRIFFYLHSNPPRTTIAHLRSIQCVVKGPDDQQTTLSDGQLRLTRPELVLATFMGVRAPGTYHVWWYGSRPDSGFYEVAHGICEWPPSSEARGHRFESPPDADLAIYLETEHVDPFEFKAIIVDVRIRVENLTDKPKRTRGITWQLDTQSDQGVWRAPEVSQAEHEHKRDLPGLPSRIGARQIVSGWATTALPYDPTGGVGAYSIHLDDEIGTRYTFRQTRRPGQPYT
jgi:hypothetical protein